MVYVVRIYKNNKAHSITLPALLCRGLGLTVGDTLMLDVDKDGRIILFPPKLTNSLVQQMREGPADEGVLHE